MKYDARVNEYVARLMGLARARPCGGAISQGALLVRRMLRVR